MRRGQRLPDAGIRVLVYFTGTVVCRPDLGGPPLIAADLTRAEIAERMELPEYAVANLELSFHRMWGGDTRHDIVTVALERGLLEDHRG